MANLLARLARRTQTAPEESRSALSFDAWLGSAGSFLFNGIPYTYGVSGAAGSPAAFAELVGAVQSRYGIVASAVYARQLVLSQLRFQYRNTNRRDSAYGRLFGNPALAPLERPNPPILTRPTMLATMEAHASFAGNAYVYHRLDGRLELLRPDLVDIIYLRDSDADDPAGAELAGYLYWRWGRHSSRKPETLFPDRVAHWRPEPDPRNWWRGQSWITSVIREVIADGQATEHIEKFFQHAATPNAIIRPHKDLGPDQIKEFQELFEKGYGGSANAYKTWIVGGGSDVTVIGSKLGELALKDLQGGFETRIASRSRVPATILGIREGLAGSALNAGNYAQTRRMWADSWFHPTAEALCAALEVIAPPPANAELSYDPAAVLLLQEDQKDAAEIMQIKAVTARQLVEAGYDPEAVLPAIEAGSLADIPHTGKLSVQLQDPNGTGTTEDDDE